MSNYPIATVRTYPAVGDSCRGPAVDIRSRRSGKGTKFECRAIVDGYYVLRSWTIKRGWTYRVEPPEAFDVGLFTVVKPRTRKSPVPDAKAWFNG
jgi:hypothetical protein